MIQVGLSNSSADVFWPRRRQSLKEAYNICRQVSPHLTNQNSATAVVNLDFAGTIRRTEYSKTSRKVKNKRIDNVTEEMKVK
jgi:hypothetical protein